MARRKRAITASINNVKGAKQRFVQDQQARTTSAREDVRSLRTPVEDNGEIGLWGDVLVEESEEEVEDTNGEDASEEEEGCSDWWKAESVQREMIVRRKYERIASQPHERTLQRRRDYSWDGLQRTVPRLLESTDEMSIWKWFRKSARIIGAYREGVTYGTEKFRERCCKSHRRVKARDINNLTHFETNSR
jgi:hypothetical protein